VGLRDGLDCPGKDKNLFPPKLVIINSNMWKVLVNTAGVLISEEQKEFVVHLGNC